MKFDYGKEGIEININPEWNVTILKPSLQKSFDNPIEKIKESIKNPIQYPPLKEIIKNKGNIKSVCIVVSDATRPVPSHLILKALLDELYDYGIYYNQIVILIATALHRPSREEELERILGKDIKDKIKVIDHIATDMDSLVNLGETSDNIPILINKHYFNADLKILTGYVEPHFFFGFSGGRKSIAPGIIGEETILANHSAKNIASPYARFGVYKENPLHKNAIEITKKVGADFIINVCINQNHEIVKVATGDLGKTHEMLVLYQLKHIFKIIIEPYDIIVCGNGGYPLDLNLYQAVKSMAIGEMAIKEGGTIIAVNECADGIGIGQDQFRESIFSGMSPKEIHKKILEKDIIVSDQWEIQILARILMKAEIYVISKLKKDEIGNIGLKYAESVEEAIKLSLKKHGLKAKILILPNGPQILPLLKHNNNKN
ncbi:MAG: nickel-dependent lactate racemase [Candidatus Hermodarchaeota archaeon]